MTFEHILHTPPEGGDPQEMLAIGGCQAKLIPNILPPGTPVVFSVYCQAESERQITIIVGTETKEYAVGTDWQRIEFAAESAGDVYIMASDDTEIYLYKAQMETGNRASDWRPAPEDTDAEIGSAQETANSAEAAAIEALGDLREIRPYLNPTDEGFVVGMADAEGDDAAAYTMLLANDGVRVRQRIETGELRTRQMIRGAATTSPEYRVGEPDSMGKMCSIRVAPDGGIMIGVED